MQLFESKGLLTGFESLELHRPELIEPCCITLPRHGRLWHMAVARFGHDKISPDQYVSRIPG